jgi:hypothetical protein
MAVRDILRLHVYIKSHPVGMQASCKLGEIPGRAVIGIYPLPVIREIVMVECRFIQRRKQYRSYTEMLKVVDFLPEAPKVALPVAVGVKEAPFEHVIDNFLWKACGGKKGG